MPDQPTPTSEHEPDAVPYRRTERLGRGERHEVWCIEPEVEGAPSDDDGRVWVPRGVAGAPLALKVASESGAGRRSRDEALRYEAHVLGRIEHPGVARVVAVISVGNRPGLVLLLAERPPVGATRPDDAWTVAVVAGALADVADALAAVHRAGFVHGDVSCTNIVFTGDATGVPHRPVLIDFGCAHPIGEIEPARRRREAQRGTPGMAAPETADGRPPGPPHDVHGLGAVGRTWLSGAVDGAGPPGARAAVSAICGRLSHPDPAARPVDLGAVAAELRGVAAGTSGTTRSEHDVAASTGAVDPILDEVTVEFGPRPPSPRIPTSSAVGPGRFGHARTRLGVACVVAATCLCACVVGWLVVHRVGQRSASTTQPVLHLAHATGHCPVDQGPGEVRAGSVRHLDLLGTGCPQTVRWTPGHLVVSRSTAPGEPIPADPIRYRLGRRGDVLVVAGAHCRGLPDLVIYRPATGELLGYPGLPDAPGRGGAVHPTRRLTGVRNGHVLIARSAGGCGRVTVARGDHPAS